MPFVRDSSQVAISYAAKLRNLGLVFERARLFVRDVCSIFSVLIHIMAIDPFDIVVFLGLELCSTISYNKNSPWYFVSARWFVWHDSILINFTVDSTDVNASNFFLSFVAHADIMWFRTKTDSSAVLYIL